jgi:TolB protein
MKLISQIALLATIFISSNSFAYDHSKHKKPAKPEYTSAEAAKLEAKFFKNAKQLTNFGQNGEAYFSVDGKNIIFQSIRGEHPFYQIYTMNLKTGKTVRISNGKGRTTCAYFHPTKNKVLFSSSHLDPNEAKQVAEEKAYLAMVKKDPSKKRRGYKWSFDPKMDIFEANLDGSGLRRLTIEEGYDAEAAYSADGKVIAFSSTRDNNPGNLFVMDSDGKNVRQLTKTPGYDGGPFISPDMKKVIYRGEFKKKHLLQIYAIDIDGKNKTQLTNNNDVNWAPYWFKDSKHIIYTTSRHGHANFELYIQNIETKAEKRVTFTDGADVLPVFSPDGKKILWTSKRGNDKDGKPSSQLWIADWNYDFSTMAAH